MMSENKEREQKGLSQAYGEVEFMEVINRNGLDYNEVVKFFQT